MAEKKSRAGRFINPYDLSSVAKAAEVFSGGRRSVSRFDNPYDLSINGRGLRITGLEIKKKPK